MRWGRVTMESLCLGFMGCPAGSRIARVASTDPVGLTGADALERSDYRRLHSEILDVVLEGDRVDDVVDFEYEAESVVSRVDSGEAQVGIVMRSIPMREFVDIVTRGDRLPPKATNFYPKTSGGGGYTVVGWGVVEGGAWCFRAQLLSN